MSPARIFQRQRTQWSEIFYKGFGFEKISEENTGASQWALAVDGYHPRDVQDRSIVNEL